MRLAWLRFRVLPSAEEDVTALFRDITASGIDFRYRNGCRGRPSPSSNRWAAAWPCSISTATDELDIFLPGGGFFEGKQIRGNPANCIAISAAASFDDVSDRLHIDGDWFYSHGAAVGDYDRDGWPDLLLTGWDRLALFHNEPVDPKDARRAGNSSMSRARLA